MNSPAFQSDSCHLSIGRACRIFGVSRSGYYAWSRRKRDPEIQAQKEAADRKLKEQMCCIVKKLGYVPGTRGFKSYLDRDYDQSVSRKTCGRLMDEMHLVANVPLKDPYKHQATHDHEYAAPAENLVKRNFFIAPRKIILTDITYLYYDFPRVPFYACVLRDAFTKECLGWETSQRMTVEDLVRPAYEKMVNTYPELRNCEEVFVHSDQGSQYLSTTFRRLLEDDKFVQSVSGRGNALDNAPMESFFGRLKTNIMKIVALAPDFETASDLVNGYFMDYNEKHYQYNLAGLTPREFYLYITTGVYPCESYFGVDGSRLNSPEELIRRRRKQADKEAEKARERAQKARENAGKDPMKVVNRDIRRLEKLQKDWTETANAAKLQIDFLDKVLKQAEAAREFIHTAPDDLKEKLFQRTEWKLHPQLRYIYDMKGLY